MVNIKNIWETHRSTGNVLIKTKIEDISHLNCFAATNNITGQYLYIMSVSKNISIPELRNYRFKGVEIFSFEGDSSFELNIYLLDNDLKDIFALFIQNVLEDVKLSINENDALIKTLNVVSKWKKLFDKISFEGLTLEYQKGLIGELLFINSVLDDDIQFDNLLNAWTGPDLDDKDFRFGDIGIEIKLTSSKHPKIKITNEGQLDIQNLDKLFLILYVVESVKENGFSLNSLVSQIRAKLNSDFNSLKLFNERLLSLGYLQVDEEYYNIMFATKEICYYSVEQEFPKVTKSQLSLGIYNISYCIELSAVENFKIEQSITNNLINGKSSH